MIFCSDHWSFAIVSNFEQKHSYHQNSRKSYAAALTDQKVWQRDWMSRNVTLYSLAFPILKWQRTQFWQLWSCNFAPNQTLWRKFNDPNKRSSLYFSVSLKKHRSKPQMKSITWHANIENNERSFVYLRSRCFCDLLKSTQRESFRLMVLSGPDQGGVSGSPETPPAWILTCYRTPSNIFASPYLSYKHSARLIFNPKFPLVDVINLLLGTTFQADSSAGKTLLIRSF